MDKREIEARLNALHQLLSRYDYIGIKIATGRATKEDYTAEITQMKAWEKEINKLETQLADYENY